MFVQNSEVVDIIKLLAICNLVDNTKVVLDMKVGVKVGHHFSAKIGLVEEK